MAAHWAMGLAQIYFATSVYLVVQDWIHVAILSPDKINTTEPLYTIIMIF